MDELERVELLSVLDLFAAAPADLRDELDLAVLELDGATAFSVGADPKPLIFNRVVGLVDDAPLPQLERWCAQRRCPLVVPLQPGTALEERLRTRGYRHERTYMRFRRGVQPPPEAATSLGIEVLDERHAEEYGSVVATVFGILRFAPWFATLCGREGWSCVGAFDGNRLVATGASFVAGDLGWLGAAGTLPHARGRGAQTALLVARIAAARDAGARVLTVETSDAVDGETDPSFRNVVRAGFEEAFRQQWWELP